MNVSALDISKLLGWSISGNLKTPGRVACECPHCSVVSTFTVSSFPNQLQAAIKSSCPACSTNVVFFFILGKLGEQEQLEPIELYIQPAYKRRFKSSIEASDVPEPLYRAIQTANHSFNSGNFPATAVTGRRALEGIFKYLVDEKKRQKPLHQLIEEVKSSSDLSAPLTKLSHAIRQGGNLGAHFDFEREPDEDMARTIIELLDYLINYLYILPRRIEDLEARL